MGLVEGKHFTVKMPGEGRDGYVYIRREGLNAPSGCLNTALGGNGSWRRSL